MSGRWFWIFIGIAYVAEWNICSFENGVANDGTQTLIIVISCLLRHAREDSQLIHYVSAQISMGRLKVDNSKEIVVSKANIELTF